MIDLFSSFVFLWSVIGGILAAGIIFEKQLIKLEDAIDEKIRKEREKRK